MEMSSAGQGFLFSLVTPIEVGVETTEDSLICRRQSSSISSADKTVSFKAEVMDVMLYKLLVQFVFLLVKFIKM